MGITCSLCPKKLLSESKQWKDSLGILPKYKEMLKKSNDILGITPQVLLTVETNKTFLGLAKDVVRGQWSKERNGTIIQNFLLS